MAQLNQEGLHKVPPDCWSVNAIKLDISLLLQQQQQHKYKHTLDTLLLLPFSLNSFTGK